MKYDSRADTLEHIQNVQTRIFQVVFQLLDRAKDHDQSKLHDPEKSVFDEYTPKLKALTYGSDEYKEALRGMGEALKHHYMANRHHPEYWEEGINGMGLIDLIEMLCDWKAATERHHDGDMMKSLEHNRERFGISPQLARILENTVKHLGWR